MSELPRAHPLPFVTHGRSHCVWSLSHAKDNLHFLDGLDPDYFVNVGAALAPRLETDERQHTAMVIRAL
jgi:hypothetical protein